MGHFTTITRQMMCASFGISGFAAVAFATSVGLTLADPANAQSKKPAPPPPTSDADQKKIAAAGARRAYDAGVQAYLGGKHQAAIDQFSTALRGGGLSSAEMAKALYLRGACYKRLNKPGLAISDLTSALWLKNGLGQADQELAKSERADAYRMAGLSEGSAADSASIAAPNPSPAGAKAAAPPTGAAAPAAAAAVPAAIPAPIPSSVAKAQAAPAVAAEAQPVIATPERVSRQAADSQSAIDAANARRIAAQPVENNGMQAVASATLVGGGPSPAPASVPVSLTEAAAPPSTPPAAAVADSGPLQSLTPSFGTSSPASGPVLSAAPIEDSAAAPSSGGGLGAVGGFFSNLFSGGGSTPASTPETASGVTTASTTPPAATSSWSDTTSVAAGNSKPATSKTVQVAAVGNQAAAAAAPGIKSGKYKLHIAAVRSREEADALARKLSAEQGTALKNRLPVVDEAVIGSMGTFYRVRVGSYASPEEPRGVCNSLRSSGYDCLVVTN